MDESPKRNLSYFFKERLKSLGVGLALALLVAALITNMFSEWPQGTRGWSVSLLGELLTLVLGAWFADVLELFRTRPERYVQERISRILSNHPKLQGLIEARLRRMLDALFRQVGQLSEGDGEAWTAIDRLQAANDICDGFGRINRYVATYTDAPYYSTEAIRSFYSRQAKKLPPQNTRRLLIYPIKDLVTELNSDDRLEYLDEFVNLHLENGFELRYWPYSIEQLRVELELLMGPSATPRLADFGIINDSVVFGQSATESDIVGVTGRGYIITSPGEVRYYTQLFESLWEQTKDKCFPAEQLKVLRWLCHMRRRCVSQCGPSCLSGTAFFQQVVDRIASAKGIRAVDIAPDMRLWWNKSEYRAFLYATIQAATKGKHTDVCFSRIYLLRRGLETRQDSEQFLRHVILPQVEAGVHIGLVYFGVLIERKLGVVDCIFDDTGSGWGFYLLPSDSFSASEVSQAKNLIDPDRIMDFEQLYRSLQEAVPSYGWLLRSSKDINEKRTELLVWLERAPRKV